MKKLVRSVIGRAVQNDLVWRCFNATINRVAQIGSEARATRGDNQLIPNAVRSIVSDLVVKHGPFQGMKIVDLQASPIGEMPIFPMLLGSFEQELHPIWERIFQAGYSDVINVGCAEGYYAVGCALRMPNTMIHAYDIKPLMRQQCEKLAELNGVSHRVKIGSFCTSETLARLSPSKRALVFSDCEGYEIELLPASIVPKLSPHDLLIEAHDFVDISISKLLESRFQSTHNIQIVQSVDDIRKAYTYQYQELESFTLTQRRRLLAERRPTIMQWFYMTSKQPALPIS